MKDIRDQCLAAEVPFFFKQWGGVFKSRNGRTLKVEHGNRCRKSSEPGQPDELPLR